MSFCLGFCLGTELLFHIWMLGLLQRPFFKINLLRVWTKTRTEVKPAYFLKRTLRPDRSFMESSSSSSSESGLWMLSVLHVFFVVLFNKLDVTLVVPFSSKSFSDTVSDGSSSIRSSCELFWVLMIDLCLPNFSDLSLFDDGPFIIGLMVLVMDEEEGEYCVLDPEGIFSGLSCREADSTFGTDCDSEILFASGFPSYSSLGSSSSS